MSYPSSLRLKSAPQKEKMQPISLRKKETQENIPENINRQLGRTGLRIAETVLGAPRAFGEFGEMLVPEKLIKKGAEKFGLREPVEKGLEFAKEHAPYKLFPKSEEIRELNKTIFGSKAEPKNEWEAKADETISDFAALAIPLPGNQFKVLKPALLALGGNLVKEGIGQLGGTDKQQSYAKLGTMIAGSFINPKAASDLRSALYSKAKASRPADAVISAKNLLNKLESFEDALLKGDPDAKSKKKTLDLIKTFRTKVKSGNISLDELEEYKRNINEARGSLYEEFQTNKPGRESAKKNLNSLSGFVDDSLKEYGKTNPEWESFYRPANEVHGAIAESHKARNWLARHAKKWGLTSLLAEIGIHKALGFGGSIGIPLAAGTVGTAGLLGGELATQLFKSPTLRKHYMNLINSALKEDVVAAHENLKRIQKEIEEDQSLSKP